MESAIEFFNYFTTTIIGHSFELNRIFRKEHHVGARSGINDVYAFFVSLDTNDMIGIKADDFLTALFGIQGRIIFGWGFWIKVL